MDKFAALFGRQYHLFDYVGAADAERVIVCMGSGSGVVEETVEKLIGDGARRSGWSRCTSIRPFDKTALLAATPESVKKIAVLDRTKEPGANGEPLYQDVSRPWPRAGTVRCRRSSAAATACSSKEFTPAHGGGRLRRAVQGPAPAAVHRRHQGRRDLPQPRLRTDDFSTEGDDVTRAVFFGLGSDGTVSANRSSVKIIGENTPLYSQGYFVYDSRKAGSVTTSHVRFSPRPIKGSYLVHKANFVACHQFQFTERIDMLSMADAGGDVPAEQPLRPGRGLGPPAREVQKQIVDKKLKFYVVDAYQGGPRGRDWACASTP